MHVLSSFQRTGRSSLVCRSALTPQQPDAPRQLYFPLGNLSILQIALALVNPSPIFSPERFTQATPHPKMLLALSVSGVCDNPRGGQSGKSRSEQQLYGPPPAMSTPHAATASGRGQIQKSAGHHTAPRNTRASTTVCRLSSPLTSSGRYAPRRAYRPAEHSRRPALPIPSPPSHR